MKIYEEEIGNILETEIRENRISGAQAACFLNGEKVVHKCAGYSCLETKRRTETDTIYRIYSMTKPVTAVAAMILKERGILDFEEPVSKYFPEYEYLRIWGKSGKQKVSLKIRNLLNMDSGIVYPGPKNVQKEMDKIFEDMKNEDGIGLRYTLREVIRRIAECPLAFFPGAGWQYGLSADILGGIIQEISQMSLGEFLKKEIFVPLEMEDTGFYVPIEKQERFAELYRRTESGLKVEKERYLGLTLCLEKPSFESGGAGLVSTLEDYSHFANMLAGGGLWNQTRILKRESIQQFTKNCLRENVRKMVGFPQMKGYGYGNLMRCLVNESEIPGKGKKGEFGWDGWARLYFMVNLEQKFTILYFTQISNYQDWRIIWKIRNVLYDAIL